ncbi:elongation factor G [Secundilactobacillus paracollinoides]|uniref:elongation factor G n=1 Tax=Secundilactobacillus paracollinoides TaxID=240427 RepID=UPI0006F02A51|nr:TetM/TetW/TetO/TetS family tetracycline resistance ribosomal protection protein [Secundilactobacillus paracollinoides]KRL77208.1 translation elongation factor (GTPase) [Secundilactobacillus paracollinoides DSM 15502 = JCM 11969]
MKHIVAGIIAHVDAGKTTLSEALLYRTGAVRKLGRVDNGDAFLDSDDLEKQRGITIFSHEASLQSHELQVDLLDTPGHVDFASQTEQVLSVLDYAILVVSATDGVQGYTRTLWRLLKRYSVPTFIFVNKMDVAGTDRNQVLTQLQDALSTGCIAFDGGDNAALPEMVYEDVAMQNDTVLDTYLETGDLTDDTVRQMIKRREVFPCYFGAALKVDGVDGLLAGLEQWTTEPQYGTDFGAQVFKISHDEKDVRLTWLRVTGGSLHIRDTILGDQKANQLRIYNGTRFTAVQEVTAGQVCAIPNLTDTHPGLGLGKSADAETPMMQPVLTYSVDTKDYDIQTCLKVFRELEDEDPQLHIAWSEHLQEIRVQIMGEVQLEILQQILHDRFNLDVGFGEGSILYRETITQAVEGVGHFEPLRHYSEVHLLMRPAPQGSGLTFDADCPVEVLGKNIQHQILTSLTAKEHLGVLTGSPITDMHVTLVTGRSSVVHTVGGDFREATWRALRQGLMMLREPGGDQLLEPWYRFRLEVGQDQIGRAMTDITRMSGTLDDPETTSEGTNTISGMTTLTGIAPVSEMQNYAQEVNAYTHGQGQLECLIDGYRPCHNAEAVVVAADYDPVGDLENTPGSVFCAHGAGYPVPWDDVPAMAHVAYRFTADELAAMTE